MSVIKQVAQIEGKNCNLETKNSLETAKHPCLTAPSKSTPSKTPSKKVVKIGHPKQMWSWKSQPQATLSKCLSPSKIWPKPQAKIKNYTTLSKLQIAVVRQNVSLPKQNFSHPKQIRVSISPQANLVACLGPWGRGVTLFCFQQNSFLGWWWLKMKIENKI